MGKYLVLLLALSGCAETGAFKPQAPSSTEVETADATLAAVQDDTAHDNIAGSWAHRLHEQGKGREAVEVASRIRNDRIREAVLAEVQPEGGR